MNDVNKNLRAFHLSIDELLKALAHSEDVNRTVAHNIIACRIRGYHPSAEDEIETGEYLELKSFYDKTIKLSIGMIGQTGYWIYSDKSES